MPIDIALDRMTVAEKLQLIEVIWDDLTQDPNNVPSPAWHVETLRRREQDIAAGTTQFLDITEAKQAVRDLLK